MRHRARSRVVVVQPYLPGYRTRFFERAHERLDARGVALEVLHGPPPPGQDARRDAASCSCATEVPTTRLLTVGSVSVDWHRVGRRVGSADAVVLEQALHSLEAFPLALRRRRATRRRRVPAVAFWGHGRTYTRPVNRVEARVKDALTRQGNWFFAYTEGGADHLARRGFPRDRITVVRNSVDTVALVQARDRACRRDTAEYAQADALRQRYGLTPGRTALYLGGLDAPKRISFLLDSVVRIAGELPGFRLLVAGEGMHRNLVDAAAARPGSPVIPLGRVTGADTAVLGAVSDVMLMPGRVGLCAVDSFALRTPIVTTDWPWHAPEFEYLVHGRNALVVPDALDAYSAAVVALLRDDDRLASLRAACTRNAAEYTIEGMAERFCDGVMAMLASRDGGSDR
ncbi:glycosyltransferase family 4 protein [Streptomyces sp. NBC_00557]|uniref:glycosyltransferase family 4 protein n=1 Tax=Streptomyces sp. NBC_00557 TaxID=2975776 RepID=UPI002E80DCAD|nr:glycosyltransferase family 4 protein [Streptomyces sp. NBC_00557]WUC36908.1 glycosyltransferase family 4 protein [Streptomyces sp. NBC_00557]